VERERVRIIIEALRTPRIIHQANLQENDL
jgi:hypothetical protein